MNYSAKTAGESFDRRDLVEQEALAATRTAIQQFRFERVVFAEAMQRWKSEGWPLGQLARDHYGSKVLMDNNVFGRMKYYGHAVHWDEESGLSLLYKPSNAQEPKLTPLSAILPNLPLKRSEKGAWLFDGFTYSKLGLQRHYHYRYSPQQFENVFKEWTRRGWPIGFLLSDHFAAKMFMENGLFYFISFFGHKWTWDDENGFMMLYRERNAKTSKMTKWSDIIKKIDFCHTSEGFDYLDGVIYTSEGLVHKHQWKWKKLQPSFVFEKDPPSYSYLDIISASWGHTGLPGLGIDGNPHGHVYVEICDTKGNLYSLGQYPSPESTRNILVTPTAQLRAVFFSPDIYMAANGERSVHRVHLGEGKEGEKRVNKLLEHINEIQDYRVDENGKIWTCPTQRHNFVDYNCSDFALMLEEYAVEKLGGHLMRVEDHTSLAGARRSFMLTEEESSKSKDDSSTQTPTSSFPTGFFGTLWLNTRIYFLDCVFFVLLTLATVFGAGTESIENRGYRGTNDPIPADASWPLRFRMRVYRVYARMRRHLSPINYPLRLRVQQLHSSRLEKFSRQIYQDT